jgi:hypothetical protein
MAIGNAVAYYLMPLPYNWQNFRMKMGMKMKMNFHCLLIPSS